MILTNLNLPYLGIVAQMLQLSWLNSFKTIFSLFQCIIQEQDFTLGVFKYKKSTPIVAPPYPREL